MTRPSVAVSALAAALVLNAGCTDQSPLTAPADPESPPSLASSAPSVEVVNTRGETAFADYYIETDCTLTEVVVVGTEAGQLANRTRSFGDLVFVAMYEYDNCNFTENDWNGFASSGFTQTGVKSATLNTPITLTNVQTGETRLYNANFQWAGTGKAYVSPGHYNDMYDGERVNFYFSYLLRLARTPTAQLIDQSGRNLLSDASTGFVNLGSSTDGSVRITYP
jgi:hypothetical protein